MPVYPVRLPSMISLESAKQNRPLAQPVELHSLVTYRRSFDSDGNCFRCPRSG